jgi:hypothetical protein
MKYIDNKRLNSYNRLDKSKEKKLKFDFTENPYNKRSAIKQAIHIFELKGSEYGLDKVWWKSLDLNEKKRVVTDYYEQAEPLYYNYWSVNIPNPEIVTDDPSEEEHQKRMDYIYKKYNKIERRRETIMNELAKLF